MAEGLHIDSDWKKQAQEEKKRLSEQAAAKATTPAASAPTAAEPRGTPPRQRGQMPAAGFGTLVQSILTQALYYLGDLSARGAEPNINLDMAKYQIDTLSVIEEKTKGNLTEEEQKLLDTVLYEARMRYVSVASQFA